MARLARGSQAREAPLAQGAGAPGAGRGGAEGLLPHVVVQDVGDRGHPQQGHGWLLGLLAGHRDPRQPPPRHRGRGRLSRWWGGGPNPALRPGTVWLARPGTARPDRPGTRGPSTRCPAHTLTRSGAHGGGVRCRRPRTGTPHLFGSRLGWRLSTHPTGYASSTGAEGEGCTAMGLGRPGPFPLMGEGRCTASPTQPGD